MKRKTIIIDDHESVSNVLAKISERAGHETQCFTSAEEFFEARRCEACVGACADRLLTDLSMPPGASGFDVVRRLKELQCPIPSMALMSGVLKSAIVTKAKTLGVETFQKGCQSHEMLTWLTSS